MRDHRNYSMVYFIHLFTYKIMFFQGTNAGHLPNSFNVPYTEVFDQTNQCLKSNDELKKRKISTNNFYQIFSLFQFLIPLELIYRNPQSIVANQEQQLVH
jgi:hypothetical protein